MSKRDTFFTFSIKAHHHNPAQQGHVQISYNFLLF